MQLAALRFRRTAPTRPRALSAAAVFVVGCLCTAAAVDAADRLDWLRKADAWNIRWVRPVAGGSAPDRQPSLAIEPSLAAGVVVWNAGAAIHTVMADSGRPAWRASPLAGSALFSSGRAGGRQPLVPSAISVAGHLVYAVIDPFGDGPLLVCLDCSATAEGRLVWSVAPPTGTMTFDGPPAADHELCTIVARSADGRGVVSLVAYDARDGVVVWRRPLGSAIARDGLDHGRGVRKPLLLDDLVVVADHAGSVLACSRSGRQVWTYDYAVPIRREADATDADALPAGDSAVAAGSTIVIAPRDRGGLIALDRVGRMPPADATAQEALLWQTPPGSHVRIVGATAERVVVEATHGADRGALKSLSVAGGETVAASGPDPIVRGPAVLAGDTILRPRGGVASPLAVAVLSSETLRPLGPDFPLAPAADGGGILSPSGKNSVRLAVGRNGLVGATSGMLFFIGADTP